MPWNLASSAWSICIAQHQTCFKGQKSKQNNAIPGIKRRQNPAKPQSRSPPHFLVRNLIVFSVSNSNMNSTANRYSCCLPSASLMKLFFPALLLFVLSTGTSALIIPRVYNGFESEAIPKIAFIGMNRERAFGYWISTVCTRGFLNVVSFQKMNLDRQTLLINLAGFLLWYISLAAAKVKDWTKVKNGTTVT